MQGLARLQLVSSAVRTEHAAKMAAAAVRRHAASRQHVGTCDCYRRTSRFVSVPDTAATAGSYRGRDGA